ncbi:MAG: protein translocase subunit SecD, partial [Jatrophihabitans sp.]
MPRSAGVLRVGRYFLSLFVILVVLWGLVFLPGKSHSPKLGLDLEGGAQVIFRAKTDTGKAPSKASMKVAKQILTDRVNGSGVTEAEVIQQGSDRIVVSVPGKSTNDLKGIGAAAQLSFRPLVMAAQAPTAGTPSAGATDSGTGTSTGSTGTGTGTAGTTKSNTTGSTGTSTTAKSSPAGVVRPQNFAPTSTAPKTTPKTTPSSTAIPTGKDAPPSTLPYPFSLLGFPLPISETAFNNLTQQQQQYLTQALRLYDCTTPVKDDPTLGMVACAADGTKYLLGSVIVQGKQVAGASAQPPNTSGQGGNLQWTVQLKLKGSGQSAWAKYTAAHHSSDATGTASAASCGAQGLPCAEFVAFTLDDKVITAPHNEATINGDTQITGNFQEASATELANQLKYGALPLDFTAETTQNVSATLGTSQLKSGLLAGGIGLALVVLYSLLYYRGLGLVTIASLLVSGGLTYASLVILGREIGFTLTLAGIAGFIVAIGITADSFVVFFERIKDEVHEGRSLRVAVPRAWTRARRTIISADFVSFLAAAVLYYRASGDVKGFAFTLGLSTVLDLVVVFLFTHPLVSLLSRSRAFGSPRFTGLNALRSAGGSLALATAGAGGASSTATLDRPVGKSAKADDELIDEATVDDDVDEDTDTAITTDSEEEDTAPAKPRAKVTPGLSAAERAAARRGRTARPEPVQDDKPAKAKAAVKDAVQPGSEDDAEDADDEQVASTEPKARRRFGRRAAAAVTADDHADEDDADDDA